MQSKHGIRGSKTPGTEARAVTKNCTPPRLYDSESESESEGEYETDSDSNGNEGSPCQGQSRELSHLASTSGSSSNGSSHRDSDKNTKLRTSDAFSCFTSQQSDITDEFVLPNTSITRSPPAQVMNRNSGSDLCRTTDSSFCSASSLATGSAGSGESLFSLHINSNSFTNHIFKAGAILESGEFFKIEELQSSSMNESDDLVKFRQSRSEARGPNISIGETIEAKNVDDHEEFIVSEGSSLANHPTSHQNDEFVLPLTFPKSRENMNENKKTKKKKKKKKKGACQFWFCCKRPICHCKFPTCSCKLCSWPSCSLKSLSCSGCCTCPSSRSCCCELPNCSCKCFTCPSCSGKCFTCPSCSGKCCTWPSCCKCSSWSCCTCSCKSFWSFWDCKRKSRCLTCC